MLTHHTLAPQASSGRNLLPSILIGCLPFLTADLYYPKQKYELLQCLQDLSKDTTLPTKQQLVLEEHEMRLRLALAKNLALALTKEGDSNTTGQLVW